MRLDARVVTKVDTAGSTWSATSSVWSTCTLPLGIAIALLSTLDRPDGDKCSHTAAARVCEACR
jgi:hypothetical protein